jgi:hypothetical protein
LQPDASIRRLRRVGGPTALAHLAGLSGANLVAGAICSWSLREAGYSQALPLPDLILILLAGLGVFLMLIGSRSLALRVRQHAS